MWLSSWGFYTQCPPVPPGFTQLPESEPGASSIEEQCWALLSLSQQSLENRKLSPAPSLLHELQEATAQWILTVHSAFARKSPGPGANSTEVSYMLSDDCLHEGRIEYPDFVWPGPFTELLMSPRLWQSEGHTVPSQSPWSIVSLQRAADFR